VQSDLVLIGYAGTFPMQSERFYAALKGHGAPCKLVILPHESHGYRARESVMHTLYEMDQWLQRFCEDKQTQWQSFDMWTVP